MPKALPENERRTINVQVRINKEEKERLDFTCKALNLSYTDFFLMSLDNLSNYISKCPKIEYLDK